MTEWVSRVADGIELAGVAVIVAGVLLSTARFVASTLLWRDFKDAYGAFRGNLGRSILLGLEFLVAGDIINTILVDPSLSSVAALGGIVLIRTFLSFALETELEGTLPWRRAEKAAASASA